MTGIPEPTPTFDPVDAVNEHFRVVIQHTRELAVKAEADGRHELAAALRSEADSWEAAMA